MRIMIHSVPQRAIAVGKITAELIRQGFHKDDIFNYIDHELEGALPAFRKSIDFLDHRVIDPFEDVWHLQDDVVLSKDFVKAIAFACFRRDADVVCGFHSSADKKTAPFKDDFDKFPMYHSFPCIRIRSWVASEFNSWLSTTDDPWVLEKIPTGKFDDSLFRRFIWYRESTDSPIAYKNLSYSIVDHRSDIYGGSIVNPTRTDPLRALDFADEEEE